MKIDFKHKQAAHCENGVTVNLLRFYGINISEPMAFGIGSGYFFSHMLFLRVNGMAVTSFRVWPGVIFRRVTHRLGIKIKSRKFRDPDKAMQALDTLLEKGIPVGLLVGVFHLQYFPKEYRFHFNAHNITVFGKEGDTYYVSDPVMEHVETLTSAELRKVRFAKGTVPPRGKMYYITSVSDKSDFNHAITRGIRKTADDMLTIPLPMFGVKGIRYLAGKMRSWPQKLGEKSAAMNLGQVIRMLEEIGTGGAGFRFIYAAFLQESSEILKMPVLNDLSREMTETGDKWRKFAWQASRCFKNRDKGEITYDMLADMLLDIASREENIFRQLRKIQF
jgi:hypothetical protein